MINQKKAFSGLEGLDEALDYMRYGDCVVWQVSSIDEYRFFIDPFVERALVDRKNIVYFRFNIHKPLIDNREGIKIYDIDVNSGFETMVMTISEIIEEEGRESCYVFDSLTDLQAEWIADFMMGNFFVVTAPEVAKTNSIAYFSVTRNYHSIESMSRVRETATVLIDVFKGEDNIYMQPIKVQDRYLPTIFLPHRIKISDTENITPLTNGIDLSHFYALVGQAGDMDSTQNLDNRERFFINKKAEALEGASEHGIRDLCRMVFGADERILDIAEKNVNLTDLLAVKARMIGVGSIGGKATGMILSRKIVEKKLPEVAEILEPHDSFYICSNLYYTFLIKNKSWSLKIKQRKRRGYFTVAEIIKEKILEGRFSDPIREQFRRLLEYYGQSPIIVRSSSLLEDGFGNAFAGKYESVFCVNKGTLEERLVAFEDAVRRVYASTMDESVLEYRLQRGLELRDEQMALLVQRVTGSLFKDMYMPAAAGVAFSYNAYRWDERIDPDSGMIRIVMGLGTRAVDRTDGDYPRIAALGDPELRSMHSKYISDFAQHKVDVLDLQVNAHATVPIEEVADRMSGWFKAIMIEHDSSRENDLRQYGMKRKIVFTTCENLLRNEEFVGAMRKILSTLQAEYDYPVDVEFALNISKAGGLVINLLQCRPLQVGGAGIRMRLPDVPQEKTFFHLNSGTMGGAYYQEIGAVVRIDPKRYYEYPYNQKPAVARVVGQINQYYKDSNKVIMFLSPGRIGTSSPELGVPVKFAEISNMSIACELAYAGAGYRPELSFGSHFFQDLVEADIFYAAIFENKETTLFYAPDFFSGEPNIVTEVSGIDDDDDIGQIIQVYDMSGRGLRIISDIANGETLCGYFEAGE
jgi:predicted RNA binding protein with dsRBD fold (UPF0201 family)